jgi:hypothetical protein
MADPGSAAAEPIPSKDEGKKQDKEKERPMDMPVLDPVDTDGKLSVSSLYNQLDDIAKGKNANRVLRRLLKEISWTNIKGLKDIPTMRSSISVLELLAECAEDRLDDGDNSTIMTMEEFLSEGNLTVTGLRPIIRRADNRTSDLSHVKDIDDYKKKLAFLFPIINHILPFPNLFLAGGAASRPFWSVREEKHEKGTRYAKKDPKKDVETVYEEVYLSDHSDLDFFLISDEASLADTSLKALNHIIDAIEKSCVGVEVIEHFDVYRRRGTITIKHSSRGFRANDLSIQLIVRPHPSIAACINDFDLGSSMVAYDGEEVYITRLGALSLKTMTNIVDVSRRSRTYEDRMRKYWMRGFGIVFPHMNKEKEKEMQNSRMLKTKHLCIKNVSNFPDRDAALYGSKYRDKSDGVDDGTYWGEDIAIYTMRGKEIVEKHGGAKVDKDKDYSRPWVCLPKVDWECPFNRNIKLRVGGCIEGKGVKLEHLRATCMYMFTYFGTPACAAEWIERITKSAVDTIEQQWRWHTYDKLERKYTEELAKTMLVELVTSRHISSGSQKLLTDQLREKYEEKIKNMKWTMPYVAGKSYSTAMLPATETVEEWYGGEKKDKEDDPNETHETDDESKEDKKDEGEPAYPPNESDEKGELASASDVE